MNIKQDFRRGYLLAKYSLETIVFIHLKII